MIPLLGKTNLIIGLLSSIILLNNSEVEKNIPHVSAFKQHCLNPVNLTRQDGRKYSHKEHFKGCSLHLLFLASHSLVLFSAFSGFGGPLPSAGLVYICIIANGCHLICF